MKEEEGKKKGRKRRKGEKDVCPDVRPSKKLRFGRPKKAVMTDGREPIGQFYHFRVSEKKIVFTAKTLDCFACLLNNIHLFETCPTNNDFSFFLCKSAELAFSFFVHLRLRIICSEDTTLNFLPLALLGL